MIRLATYNVEWFSSLFDNDNRLAYSNDWSGRYNVTKSQQINALGRVFKAIKADAIMIIEAPNSGGKQATVPALEAFAANFNLRQNRALIGFENDTQQEIALLYDPKIIKASHDPIGHPADEFGSTDAPRFDSAFKYDFTGKGDYETIIFSKPPLEVSLEINGNAPIRLIGVHAKSKAPHGAKNKRQEREIALANRRKQLAQCAWIRQRVDGHLVSGEQLIVLGDFNDGPGLDIYEEIYGKSGIEYVLGRYDDPLLNLFDPHASVALSSILSAAPTTSRFFNHRTKTYLNALLDYIMVSHDIHNGQNPYWKIWHPFDNPECFENRKLQKALLLASDHFPVTIDLETPKG